MKKLFIALLGASVMLGSATSLMAGYEYRPVPNMSLEIPVIDYKNDQWEKIPDAAQYGDADWKNVVGRAKNVTVKEAIEIAESHPEITFFFFMKGRQMVLGKSPNVRIFRHGDAVFFTGEPTFGAANGLADGYIKKSISQQ